MKNESVAKTDVEKICVCFFGDVLQIFSENNAKIIKNLVCDVAFP
jgi:hypothetical protein